MINRWHCPLRKIGEQDYRQIYKANSPNGKKRRQNHGACSSVWHADLCACSISPAVWRRSIGRMSALSGKYRTIVSQPESQRAVSSNRGGGGNGPQESCGRLHRTFRSGYKKKKAVLTAAILKDGTAAAAKGMVFLQAEKCKKPDLSFWRNPALLSMPFLFRLFPKPLEQPTFSQKKRLSPNFRFATAPTLWTFQGNKALIWQTPCYGFRGSR